MFCIQNFEGNYPFIIFLCNNQPPPNPSSILQMKPPPMVSLYTVTAAPNLTPKTHPNTLIPSSIMKIIKILLKTTSKSSLAQKETLKPIRTKTRSFLNQLQATFHPQVAKIIKGKMEIKVLPMNKI